MDINSIPSLEELEKMTTEQVRELVHPDSEVLPIYDIVGAHQKPVDAFPTGIKIFDRAMRGGMRGGDLIVISGISGEGKTTLSQTLTYNLCSRNVPTLWFSYEVSLAHLNNKFIEMGMAKHYFAYSPKKNQSGSIDWIKDRILEGWKKYLTKVIFIDHIDFLTPSNIKTSDNEMLALKKIATELKQLAVHLDVAIVLMAHVKKLPSGKEPEMQDISSSSGIYQLADFVFLINRAKEEQKGFLPSQGAIYKNQAKVKLVKNRLTGETVYTELEHRDQRFQELQTKNTYGKQTASSRGIWSPG